jgi:hypothetical protein
MGKQAIDDRALWSRGAPWWAPGFSFMLAGGRWGGFRVDISRYMGMVRIVLGWVAISVGRIDLDHLVGHTLTNWQADQDRVRQRGKQGPNVQEGEGC